MVHSPGEVVESDDDLFSDNNQENKRQRIDEAVNQEEQELAAVVNVACASQPSTPIYTGPSLHEMIEGKQWDRLLRRVEELRRNNARNGARIPELHETTESTFPPLTPLQRVLEMKADATVTSAPDASVISALVDSETVQVRHEFLRAPLFLACQYVNDPECIRKIIDAFPEAILENHDGMSIFHAILQNKPPLDLVEHMVQVWAEQQGVDVDTAWSEITKDVHVDDEGHNVLPIHYAVQTHAPTDVILKLLEKDPDSALETLGGDSNEANYSTIHLAVFHGCTQEVLEALVENCVGALSDNRIEGTKRKFKDTPLHLLFHKDNKNRWLKDKAPADVMPPRKMAWFLIQKHAYHAKKELGAKKANPKDIAKEYVFTKKGAGNYTVNERAQDLNREIERETWVGSQELKDILDDFRSTIFHCRRFPDDVLVD